MGSCAKGSHSAAQGFDASRRDESNKAARARETWHSPSQGYFIIWGTETCSQNGDHSLRSRTDRERAPTTKICAAIRGVPRVRTQPHRAATHRGVTSRTKQRAHKKAWHSPSQGYFIILGTKTCSQNGDHYLHSRAHRERAPTTKICAVNRGVVRQGFTLSRTRPRRTVPRRLVRALLCSARHSAMRRGLVWLSVSRWRAATRVVIRAKRLKHSVRGVWHSSIPTPKLLPKRHPVFWRRG